jgi:hypothetical protein
LLQEEEEDDENGEEERKKGLGIGNVWCVVLVRWYPPKYIYICM